MKLIFVYNAHSGRFNAYLDSLHKILSPTTYSCKLCKLTHGTLRERTLWKDFREKSKFQMEFLHKDEFLEIYSYSESKDLDFPVLIKEENSQFEVLIAKEDFDQFKTEKELVAAINLKTKLL